ncbi:MAG: 16S rRNA (adenine(1518)-N(6)/adenine(1519)-N(6))-dimethyltransferase, partial [Firmicutes bacterium]|nr:16S rRNA (adenine(1518)-N(6)/adenine(1519)-N(6))-dimethyltransferase [Bacillota bacterium]
MSQNIDYKFVLQSQGFEFKKGLGQNFVFDTNLLNAIATDADIQSSDTVVEIGVGAGSLTNIIADRASRVVGFEIDKRLQAVHKLTIQRDSVEVKYKDFLQLNDNDIVSFGVYKVVANLPYYITTPIIFKLLESNNPPKSITIMVQKEVANRIVAKPNTPDYGV